MQEGTIQVTNPLKNGIMTGESFRKTWVDSEGNPIDADYLGLDLSVTFTLQVAEKSSQDGDYTNWSDAETYFKDTKNLSKKQYQGIFVNDSQEYQFSRTLKGSITDTIWNTGGRFEKLPTVIQKQGDNSLAYLEYRVVESQITYGNANSIQVTVTDSQETHTYTYTFGENPLFRPYYGQGAASNPDTATEQKNQLVTAGMTVNKVWEEDHDNQFHTRPATERPGYTWETRFLIQQSIDDGTTWTRFRYMKTALRRICT